MPDAAFWQWTIGDVGTIVTVAALVLSAYLRLRDQLVEINTKVEPLWRQFVEDRRRAPR